MRRRIGNCSCLPVPMALVLTLCLLVAATFMSLIPLPAYGAPSNSDSVPGNSVLIKQKIKSILENPQYSLSTSDKSGLAQSLRDFTDRIQRKWNRVVTWARKQWERLMKLLFSGVGIASESGNLFIALFLAITLITSAYLLYRYVKNRNRSLRPNVAAAAWSAETIQDVIDMALSKSAEEWNSEGEQLAREGRFREAIRSCFLSTIVTLDQFQILDYTRSATNGDFLVAARTPEQEPIANKFGEIVTEYEYRWYGIHDADQATYARCAENRNQIAGAAGSGAHQRWANG